MEDRAFAAEVTDLWKGRNTQNSNGARDKAEGVSRGQITSLDFIVMATGSH